MHCVKRKSRWTWLLEPGSHMCRHGKVQQRFSWHPELVLVSPVIFAATLFPHDHDIDPHQWSQCEYPMITTHPQSQDTTPHDHIHQCVWSRVACCSEMPQGVAVMQCHLGWRTLLWRGINPTMPAFLINVHKTLLPIITSSMFTRHYSQISPRWQDITTSEIAAWVLPMRLIVMVRKYACALIWKESHERTDVFALEIGEHPGEGWVYERVSAVRQHGVDLDAGALQNILKLVQWISCYTDKLHFPSLTQSANTCLWICLQRYLQRHEATSTSPKVCIIPRTFSDRFLFGT